MGRKKKRGKPCGRAEDCCLFKPCRRSTAKKKGKNEEKDVTTGIRANEGSVP